MRIEWTRLHEYQFSEGIDRKHLHVTYFPMYKWHRFYLTNTVTAQYWWRFILSQAKKDWPTRKTQTLQNPKKSANNGNSKLLQYYTARGQAITQTWVSPLVFLLLCRFFTIYSSLLGKHIDGLDDCPHEMNHQPTWLVRQEHRHWTLAFSVQ